MPFFPLGLCFYIVAKDGKLRCGVSRNVNKSIKHYEVVHFILFSAHAREIKKKVVYDSRVYRGFIVDTTINELIEKACMYIPFYDFETHEAMFRVDQERINQYNERHLF